MNGAMKTASSRDSDIIPATNWLNVLLMPYGRSAAGSLVRGFSPASSQMLMWRWPDEPVHVWSGFAMNVMPQPFRYAISFAPCLKITLRSADSRTWS
jgi:hypothetical protein